MSMNLEEIMKPYLDKKEEIKKEISSKEVLKKERLEQINVEKNVLNLRLERLIENKEEEINQYVKQSNNPDFNFYRSYASVLRKDLEKNYADKENEIKEEIKKLEKEEESLNNENYLDMTYAKGLPGIKETARVELNKLILEIETKIERKEIELKLIDLDIENLRNSFYSWEAEEALSKMQPYYKSKEELSNNINELKELLGKSKDSYRLLFKDEELEEILKGKILEEQKFIVPVIDTVKEDVFVEPTIDDLITEEMSVIEESSPKNIEKLLEELEPMEDELDEELEEVVDEQKIEEEIDKVLRQEQEVEDTQEDILADLIDEENPIVRPNVQLSDEVVANSYSDLIQLVYTDIVDFAENFRSIKLDPSRGDLSDSQRYISSKNNEEDYAVEGYVSYEDACSLPNGVYVNEKDMKEAIDNYTKENKGRVFRVEAVEEVLEITKNTARKLKKVLKKCSTIKLLKENKLSSFDIKRVFGKEVAEEYTNEVELGTVKTDMPIGTYVNRDEFIGGILTLFKEKKPSWLTRIGDKVLRDLEKDEEELEDSVDKILEKNYEKIK